MRIKPTLEDIFSETTKAFGISKEYYDDHSQTREREVVEIRQAVCYLGQMFGFSQNAIGNFLGVDHSTVCYNKRIAQDICDTDGEYARKISGAWAALDDIVRNQKEYTIKGWVARDKYDDSLTFFTRRKPKRLEEIWLAFHDCYSLPKDAFPLVTSECEPQECEMTLRLK